MPHLTDAQVSQAFQMKTQGFSSRKIAEEVIGRASAKSTINDLFARVQEDSFGSSQEGPKILFFDVECAPSLNLAFSRFKAFASPQHVIQEPYLLLFGYAWGVDGEVQSDDILKDYRLGNVSESNNDILLVERMWELLDAADVVVAHNSRYDQGWANQQFAKYDMPPPSNYKVVCTLKGLKKAFSLPSNSLAASTQYFDVERKLSNEGISLWRRCMEMEPEAFAEMSEYCKGDVRSLQQLYRKILAYIPQHPNMAHYYSDDAPRCRSCGSKEILAVDDKYAYTSVSKFQLLRCGSCGATQRERKNLHTKDKMASIYM